MYYVYIIESIKNSELHIGYTSDLKKRIREHNQGENESTRRYLPWQPIYYEACLNMQDAKRREKYLKTSQGRRLIKRRLKEYFYSKRKK